MFSANKTSIIKGLTDMTQLLNLKTYFFILNAFHTKLYFIHLQDSATKILHNHIRSASHANDVLSPRNVTSPPQNRSRPPSRSDHHHDMETENMNPEDIYDSIKKASADIQNLNFSSKLDNYDDVRKKREFTSQDSGIQDLRNDSPDAVDGRKGHYNPSHYQDEVGDLSGCIIRNVLGFAVGKIVNKQLFTICCC